MVETKEKNAILGVFVQDKHIFGGIMRRHDGPGWDFDSLDFDGDRARNYSLSSDAHNNFATASYALYLPISQSSAESMLEEYQHLLTLRNQGNNPYYFEEHLGVNPRFERKGEAPVDFDGHARTDAEARSADSAIFERNEKDIPRVATTCEDWLYKTVKAHTGIDLEDAMPRKGDKPENAFMSVRSIRDGVIDTLKTAKEAGQLKDFDHQKKCGKLLTLGEETYGFLYKNGNVKFHAGESGLNYFLDHVPEFEVSGIKLSVSELLESVSKPANTAIDRVNTPVTRTLAMKPDPKQVEAKTATRVDLTPSEGVGVHRSWS